MKKMELEEVVEYLKTIKEFAGDNYTFGKEGIRKLKENIQVILNHLTKQDKIIELMAEELAFGVFDFKSEEQVKQYFEKKAEERE